MLAGFHAVAARLKLDPESIQQVYVDPERRDKRMREMREKLFAAGVRVMNADAARLDGLSPDVPHQGIAAIAAERENTLDFADLLDQITDRTLLLILDGVTDPRNFGACLRAADAAGVQAVIVPRDRSARMTPAAAKAAAGAAETVPVVSVTNLASAIMELRDNGVFVAGTAGETDTTIYDVVQARAFAWVLGAEGEGLRQLTRRRCDVLAAIPMVGSVESLNVSVASGICLFESLRQRIAAGLVQPGSPDERL
ncbi:MAG TPA: 23S rRNA (guanosine(2251)-2'-O)-methyltransferase RlmB [Sutterella wadsworthensis]|nr:23S rRNA (guanosine(2251)-2'-O)-methyltransferase RlmB [Sutterella wadsworthensis]